MLKELIAKYGKDKINTLTKYPSILTLHKIGEKGKLLEEHTTPIEDEIMYGSEKIDGTNVRIIRYGYEYLLGSREFILHHSDDLYFDPAQGIVEGLKNLNIIPSDHYPFFTVIYGELFGGKVSSNSKQYGTDKLGFRVFDVAEYQDLSILERELKDISRWREHETENGIVYGQNFLPKEQKRYNTSREKFEYVPEVPFELGDKSIQTIYDNLKKAIPVTNVPLSENALMKPEGLILRNKKRSKIVKIRFEDYERTLKIK